MPKRKTPEERFWEKVDRKTPAECWEWTASVTPNGYGRFAPTHSTRASAHRYAYELVHGPIPPKLQVDHLCRNRKCVNPDHLEAVTCRENLIRSPHTLAGRQIRRTHCREGHPYDDKNTYIDARGGRVCRTCDTEYRRRKRHEQRSHSR